MSDIYHSRIAWLPALLAPGPFNALWAFTFGQTTYWTVGPELISFRARRHEACHQRQYARAGRLWFLRVPLRYLGEWLWLLLRTRSPARAYAEISYEVEARAAEDETWQA